MKTRGAPLIAIAICAAALAAAGGRQRGQADGGARVSRAPHIVSVRYTPFIEGRRDVLIASATLPPSKNRHTQVIRLSAVAAAIPHPLPKPLAQPFGQGVAHYMVIKLSNGQAIRYGPFKWPQSITRLGKAMVRVALRS